MPTVQKPKGKFKKIKKLKKYMARKLDLPWARASQVLGHTGGRQAGFRNGLPDGPLAGLPTG